MKIHLALPVLLAGLSIAGCGHRPETPQGSSAAGLPAAAIRTATARQEELPYGEEATGTVRALRRATVEPKISGVILELPVAQGQQVKAGETLAALDVRDIQSRLDQALAQRDQARLDLERASRLLRQNAIARQDVDAAEARERVSQAMVAEAETQRGFGRLAAPFDGVITRKLAEVGDLGGPGRPVVEIEDPARLRLEADVPEVLAVRLAPGQIMQVWIPALSEARALDGTLAEVSPVADPVTRTVRIKLDLPAAPGLRPGLFGRVRIPAGSARRLLIPAPALVRRGQMELVFVVGEQRARLRLVRAGARHGEQVEILAGLREGEDVAVSGAEGLIDGQPVEVRP